MVFWSAVVAHSGSMKTPSQRVILDPLVALEREAYETYQIELTDYRALTESQKGKKREETDETPAQPPTRKRYLTKDSTLETLQRLHAENPRGLLYYRDELAGVIKVRNQYRGGHGADEEAELDQWVGSAVIVEALASRYAIALRNPFAYPALPFLVPEPSNGKCWQS
jgi:hypothetical protein